MLNFSEISWIGIIAAAVACLALGGLWFTAVFGLALAAVLGREPDPGAQPAACFIGMSCPCKCRHVA